MRLQLPVKPRGPGLLRSNAQEVGTCVTVEAVEIVSVSVTVSPLWPLSRWPLRLATVAGFEWPVPTHRAIFSILDLKSKLEL